jgi:dTDP-4-dehydrorhamnose reductase
MDKKSINYIPEVWGGIECSYNRVQSHYFDQVKYAGHENRIAEDIDKFSRLGIAAMRYPVIWEKLCPTENSIIDWTGTDQALNLLRQKKINPIVGLVHHGSGPKYADFTSSKFATGLKTFAGQVAKRYPWIDSYTPVNEPLTTARFAGLYSLWFPHKRNDKAFVSILLNEMKAIVLAMQEVRKVNSEAKLVQTEDLAKIYSTPFLSYQAEFENHRRWLTYDILCGKLNDRHPMWKYFLKYAPSQQDLEFFIEHQCPPDILGLDYYATSERFLDENLARYPVHTHGHNHRHKYADVEAVRVRLNEASGIKVLLEEVWTRYKIPLVLTEVHINCDYDNQIRWFGRIWNTCRELLKAGVDIRGVTSWAMLGSFGWNRLLTEPGGHYESGAFDISSGAAVGTPLAEYIEKLSSDPLFEHPVLRQQGWWEEESRFIFERFAPEVLEEAGIPELKEDCIQP